MSKYRNKKITINGESFDSIKEANRWLVLLQLQRQGIIDRLLRQESFKIAINGIAVCRYVSDFSYFDNSGKLVVEDVKSEFTAKLPVYRLKKKLMKAVHGVDVVEIL